MLRSLAYPIACALTGAASGLLVAHLTTAPAPTCPQAPVVELRQVATALAHTQWVAQRPPPPPAPRPAVERSPLVIPEGAVTCPRENHCVITSAFLDDLLADPARLSSQARVMPSIRDGEPLGFKFYGLRPGSLPRAIGLKNGDLLTAIDGVQARTVDHVMMLLSRLRTARSFALDIERRGEPVRLRVDIE
jgi:hypothetical protein